MIPPSIPPPFVRHHRLHCTEATTYLSTRTQKEFEESVYQLLVTLNQQALEEAARKVGLVKMDSFEERMQVRPTSSHIIPHQTHALGVGWAPYNPSLGRMLTPPARPSSHHHNKEAATATAHHPPPLHSDMSPAAFAHCQPVYQPNTLRSVQPRTDGPRAPPPPPAPPGR